MCGSHCNLGSRSMSRTCRMQGFSFPLVAEVIEAVCAAGLMIADPVNARGGVGVGLCAPGRSERVRRGREVGH